MGQPEDEDLLDDEDVKDTQDTLGHLANPSGTDASTNPFTSSQEAQPQLHGDHTDGHRPG